MITLPDIGAYDQPDREVMEVCWRLIMPPLSLSLSLCGPELKEIAREKHAFSSNTDGVIEHMPQY
jgi:hypothetical protein